MKEQTGKGGWLWKEFKKSGDPSQIVCMLGLDLDTRDMTFNIPTDN